MRTFTPPPQRIDGIQYLTTVVNLSFQREWMRLISARTRLAGSTTQPVLVLFILGYGLNSAVHLAPSDGTYQHYIVAGAATTSIVTTTSYATLTLVSDRQTGQMRSMLGTPAPRFGLVVGRLIPPSIIGGIQTELVVLISVILRMGPPKSALLTGFAVGFVGGLAVGAFGMAIASRIQRTESVQTANQLILLPLVFISGAVYPLKGAPLFLQLLSYLDPIRYVLQLIRTGTSSGQGLLELTVPVAISLAVAIVSIAACVSGLQNDERRVVV